MSAAIENLIKDRFSQFNCISDWSEFTFRPDGGVDVYFDVHLTPSMIMGRVTCNFLSVMITLDIMNLAGSTDAAVRDFESFLKRLDPSPIPTEGKEGD